MPRRFSPYVFLRLGRSLSRSSSESRRRTAIGRLYYACHLKARENLSTQGVVIPRRGVHSFVIWELRRSGHPHANMLSRLKGLREDSDYELTRQISSVDVHYALTIANFIWPTI